MTKEQNKKLSEKLEKYGFGMFIASYLFYAISCLYCDVTVLEGLNMFGEPKVKMNNEVEAIISIIIAVAAMITLIVSAKIEQRK